MLNVSNLEVVYHGVVLVLKGISLKVEPGTIVALLGPNGAGKSTLLRALTGLLPIHDGKVVKGSMSFDGADIGQDRADAIVRRGVGHVMEGRRILADLTVEENLIAGAYSAPKRTIGPNLDRFYTRFPILGERRHRAAGYLSGGEQQMLAIARALMSEPKLLLLDEPSLGLAPQIVADVAELVKEVNATGVSVLLVEQNASVALDLAEYGYIMENGRIVLDGPTEQLRADEDIQEFYLGLGSENQQSYRDIKRYRRRKRWLS